MAKVLVSDKLAAEGIDILKTVADVDVNTGLSEDELCAIIGNYDALVIRSGTQVTAKVLESAKNLKSSAEPAWAWTMWTSRWLPRKASSS